MKSSFIYDVFLNATSLSQKIDNDIWKEILLLLLCRIDIHFTMILSLRYHLVE